MPPSSASSSSSASSLQPQPLAAAPRIEHPALRLAEHPTVQLGPIPPLAQMLKFEGKQQEWQHWKSKISAYLQAVGLYDVLINAAPTLGEATTSAASVERAASAEPAAVKEQETDGSAMAPTVETKETGATAAAEGSIAVQSPAEVVRRWTDASNKVFMLLIMAVQSKSLSLRINNLKRRDAHAVWAMLIAKYERNSATSLMQLMERYHSLHLHPDGTDPLGDFVAEIHSVECELQGMGRESDEDMQKLVLLKGLPASWSSIADILRVQGRTTSFEDMVARLEEFEESEKIRKQQAARAGSESASFVGASSGSTQQRFGGQQGRGGSSGGQRGNPGAGAGAGGRPRLCYTCEQPGHMMFDCPRNSNVKKCSLCRQIGHENRQCQNPRRGRGQQRGNQQQDQRAEDAGHYASAAANEDGDDDFAFIIETVLATSCVADPPRGPDHSKIVFDSASTLHASNNRRSMTNIRQCDPPISLRVADGKVIVIREQGDMHIKLRRGRLLTLKDVALDHRLAANLISVPRLTAAGYEVNFGDQCAVVRKAGGNGATVCIAPKQHNLYVLRHEADAASAAGSRDSPSASGAGADPCAMMGQAVPTGPQLQPDASSKPSEPAASEAVHELWHKRLGHVSLKQLALLSASGAVVGLPKLTAGAWESRAEAAETACEACVLGKKHRHNFASERPPEARATVPLQRVWADLVGPITVRAATNEQQELVSSLGGNRYASVIIDEATAKVWVEPIRSKDCTSAEVQSWAKRVQTSSGRRIVEFHTDSGSEYAESKLQSFFTAEGIAHTTTQPHTPEHNGMAERVNRTLFEWARAMLQEAKLGPEFWALAVQAAAYLYNRTKTVQKLNGPLVTPEEAWSQRKPSVKHIRTMFSDCWVHVPDVKRTKMEAKAQRAILVGYPDSQPGWRVLNLETGKLQVSRDVSFSEGHFTFRGDQLNRALGKEGAYKDDQTLSEMIDLMSYETALAKVIHESKAAHDKGSRNARAAARATGPKPRAAPVAVGPGVSDSESNHNSAAAQRPADAAPRAAAAAAAGAGAAASSPASEASGVPAAVSPSPAPIAAEAEDPAAEQPAIAADPNQRVTRAAAAAARAAAASVPSAHFVSDSSAPEPGSRDEDHDWGSTQRSLADHMERAFQVTQTFAEAEADAPVSFADAMAREPAEAAAWLEAMEAEMAAHRRNGTWTLVDALPAGRKAIGSKWVLVRKPQANGSVLLKARLTAKGFAQRAGVDYTETFAPTLKYTTFRFLLIDAAARDRELMQMDVKTAYLNAPMDEEVYMRQPEGFIDAARPHAVCLLIKSLYGTKQAGANWNKEVNSFITRELGYTRSQCDPCLYHRVSRSGGSMLLGLFVDDIISSFDAADAAEWSELKAAFMSKYESKDLGEAALVLGMRLTRDRSRRTIVVDQQTYIDKVLRSFNMQQCNTSRTPEDAHVSLSKHDCIPMQQREQAEHAERRVQFECLVGFLLYAAISTRLDIAHAVNQLSRFMQGPAECHWIAAKRVLRYLAATRDLGLRFDPMDSAAAADNQQKSSLKHEQSQVPLIAFADSDWAGCVDDRKSTAGFVLLYRGCPLSWISKKQATVALSSAEAEYMAIGLVLREIKWMHQMLAEIGLREPSSNADEQASGSVSGERAASSAHSASAADALASGPSLIYSDNQAALAMCRHSGSLHQRTKHIDVRHHFIAEAVKSGEVELGWVSTRDQLADIFTKALGPQIFVPLRDRLMVAAAASQAKSDSGSAVRRK
jgi:transposase InsO family protein